MKRFILSALVFASVNTFASGFLPATDIQFTLATCKSVSADNKFDIIILVDGKNQEKGSILMVTNAHSDSSLKNLLYPSTLLEVADDGSKLFATGGNVKITINIAPGLISGVLEQTDVSPVKVMPITCFLNQ